LLLLVFVVERPTVVLYSNSLIAHFLEAKHGGPSCFVLVVLFLEMVIKPNVKISVVVRDCVLEGVGSFARTLQRGVAPEALPAWENSTIACWEVVFFSSKPD
jgi:hypothetical protein